MEGSPAQGTNPGDGASAEGRAAPRFTLLIRSAKFIVEGREYLCVVRDLSATGISIRTFHPLPRADVSEIEFQTGQRYGVEKVWEREGEAGFRFLGEVDVEAVVGGHGSFPRRDLRFDLDLPVTLSARGQAYPARLVNLSRQGGSIACDEALSLAQPVRLGARGLPEIEAKVRWRKDGQFGLIFDTTFSLAGLAQLLWALHMREASGSRIAAIPPLQAIGPASGSAI